MKPILFSSILLVVAGLSFGTSPSSGQSAVGNSTSATIVQRAEPAFPTETERLSGKISVAVTIDEEGNVVSVNSVSGPGDVCPSVIRADVLAVRNAARDAALKTKFTPATTNGNAVSSISRIEYSLPELAISDSEDSEDVTYYSAAPAKGDRSPAVSADAPRYTVKGDSSVRPADQSSTSPPPNYTGPVNTTGSGAPETYTAPVEGSGKQIRGGVLNGKAIALPKPPYPPAARAVRATGAVSIQVLIETDGKVFSAAAVSGHPLLRAAARMAACGAQFSPTSLEGIPVKVAGVITYNFVP